MSLDRSSRFAAVAAFVLLLASSPARAQLSMVEPGFLGTTISSAFSKQVEVGVGPDTCLYYGSDDGLWRRCGPADPGTVCDPDLQFPAGIAFSTGGTFGSAMYVSDFATGNIYRSVGCSPGTVFATLFAPGALAFPPAGSAYGDYLYTCDAGTGPVYRVGPTGTVTSWIPLASAYMRFGPGGAWQKGLYATQNVTPSTSNIVRVTSAGSTSVLASGFYIPEGFDWGFDDDMFVTDTGSGRIMRVKVDGTTTLFATLPGAADVAFRPIEQALYVVSNQGGFYRIARHNTSDAPTPVLAEGPLEVAPNPARGPCTVRFSTREAGVTRARVVDIAGRLVRRLADAWRPAGAQSLTWDGHDETGAAVSPGIYFARVEASGESRTARVTVVR